MGERLSVSYLLQTFLDHFSDYVYFKDTKSRFLLINKTLSLRYGLKDPSEVVGKDDYDFFTSEHADEAMKDEQEIVRTGKPVFDINEKVTWVNGESTWVSSSKMPLRDPEGNIVGTFGVSRDITDRIRDQNALREISENLQKKNSEYEQDLGIAAELQTALIPSCYPSFPANVLPEESSLKFCHRYQPSAKVGGDFFEVLSLSDNEAGILFGDVMGHGVQSALIMAMVRALVVPSMGEAKEPVKFLSRINSSLQTTLRRVDRNLYATACYATINTKTGECKVANAGHLTPIWIQKSRGKCIWVPEFKSHGPLGLFEETDYPLLTLQLEPGDSLLFFTDGIMDVYDGAGTDLGKENLLKISQTNINSSPSQFLDSLISEALAYSESHLFEDDVCLLAVTWQPSAGIKYDP